jgi:hypothetical protein
VWISPNFQSERELEFAVLNATKDLENLFESYVMSLGLTVQILAQFDSSSPVCIPALSQNESHC